MDEFKIAITGHRPDKLDNDYELVSPLILDIKEKLTIIIDHYQPTEMISGVALGIDTVWALLAIEKQIPLTAAIPFIGQERIWPQRSKDIYFKILEQASKKVIVSEGEYAKWKMDKRNQWMVDHCDLLIAVWDGTTGGTYNCIKYARSKHKQILYIHLSENKISKIELI